jgi:hypothetical protein
MKTARVLCLSALMCASTLIVQPAFGGEKSIKNQAFMVNLTSSISTKDSKAGDIFTAVVLQPAEFQGSVIEGHIQKVEPAQNMQAPKARIAFEFDTLTVDDVTYKIQADLQEVVNSKGVSKVDEEGQVIAKSNTGARVKKSLFGAGLGSAIGGAMGGGMGSLIGAAAGAALTYAVVYDMTASSQNIEFFPGTNFSLVVNSKGVDNKADAAAIHQQEAKAEAAMAAQAAQNSQSAQNATSGTQAEPTPAGQQQ